MTPYLTARDPAASLDFYEAAFGFERGQTMPGPDGAVVHAEMRYKSGLLIMFGVEGMMGSTMRSPVSGGFEEPITLYVYVDDVDALFEKSRRAGAEVVSAPEDMFWGDRVTRLRDPDGYAWSFATNVGEFDPSKMPQAES
ncbi:VOC family protein [soil metagenome]